MMLTTATLLDINFFFLGDSTTEGHGRSLNLIYIQGRTKGSFNYLKSELSEFLI